MNPPSQKDVVLCAVAACKSFSKSSENFFERREGWLGWENWLTVDITRRLNNERAVPFMPYKHVKHCKDRTVQKKLDIYVQAGDGLAVEIKTNFIDDNRKKFKNRKSLPNSAAKDAEKMISLNPKVGKLLLISTCFKDDWTRDKYPKQVAEDIEKNFASFRFRGWYDCSAGDGFNLLLALSSRGRLPSGKKV